jgi:hypothetical protein
MGKPCDAAPMRAKRGAGGAAKAQVSRVRMTSFSRSHGMRQIIVGLSAVAQTDIIASFPRCASEVTRHYPSHNSYSPHLRTPKSTTPTTTHSLTTSLQPPYIAYPHQPRSLIGPLLLLPTYTLSSSSLPRAAVGFACAPITALSAC